MPSSLDNIPTKQLEEAADRLRDVGVFADENSSFLPEQLAARQLPEIRAAITSAGYNVGHLGFKTIEPAGTGVTYIIYEKDRFANDPNAPESHWRQDYYSRWHARVSLRVADWQRRVLDLKELINNWIADDSSLRIVDRTPITFQEELMEKFGVPASPVPSFDIYRGSARTMRFQPKGLYVIGANGRVDFTTKTQSVIVVDRSEALAPRSEWLMYLSNSRHTAKPLTKQSLLELLG